MPRSVSDVDKIIGSRLKVARKSAKLTQTDLAKIINASFQQIQKYERGANRISSATLISFASALNLPIMYFFEGLPGIVARVKAKAPAQQAFEKFAKSRQAEQLLRKFHGLNRDEERRLIMDMLDMLK